MPSRQRSRLGMNLPTPLDYDGSQILADAVKTCAFREAPNWAADAAPDLLGADGWPVRQFSAVLARDIGGLGGTWRCCLKPRVPGAVTVKMSTSGPTKLLNQRPGRDGEIWFDMQVPDGQGQLILQVMPPANATGVPFAGVQYLRAYRPGVTWPADPAGGGMTPPLFNPSFIDAVRPFAPGPIRVMDLLATNEANHPVVPTAWGTRAQMADASWRGRLPYEAVATLGNLLGDLWVNVPGRADDDHVERMAALFLQQIEPDRLLWVELSNEPWNTGKAFGQTAYFKSLGEQLAADPMTGLGKITNPIYRGWCAYARRAAQVMAIWRRVWGPEAWRLRTCLGAQSGNAKVGEVMLAYLRDYLGDPDGAVIRQLFTDYCVAPYMGASPRVINVLHSVDALKPLGAEDQAKAISADLDVIFNGGADPNNAADRMAGMLQATKFDVRGFGSLYDNMKVARAAGLRISFYEFGIGLPEQARTFPALRVIHSDPRFEQVAQRYLGSVFGTGGALQQNTDGVACWFSFSSSWLSNVWGMIERIDQPNTPKARAVTAWVKNTPATEPVRPVPSSPPPPPPPTPPPAPEVDFTEVLTKLAGATQAYGVTDTAVQQILHERQQVLGQVIDLGSRLADAVQQLALADKALAVQLQQQRDVHDALLDRVDDLVHKLPEKYWREAAARVR